MRRDEEEFWSDVGLFSVLFALGLALGGTAFGSAAG